MSYKDYCIIAGFEWASTLAPRRVVWEHSFNTASLGEASEIKNKVPFGGASVDADYGVL